MRNANKEGVEVGQSKDDYKSKIMHQLVDKIFYRSLSCGPTLHFNQEIHKFLQKSSDD